MTQEEKQLLIKDLCARLPYGTKVSYNGKDEILSTLHIFDMTHIKEEYVNIKPYLRPMSSMTKEEADEWVKASNMNFDMEDGFFYCYDAHLSVDWLNAHHFDYRCLIEKGLAIAVTEENNPYKE